MYTITYSLRANTGKAISNTHGYDLYAGLCNELDELKNDKPGFKEAKAIYPLKINGDKTGDLILLMDWSQLTIRSSLSPDIMLRLIGKNIEVGGVTLRIGSVTGLYPLEKTTRLYSAFVTYQGMLTSAGAMCSAVKELNILGIKGRVYLIDDKKERNKIRSNWVQIKDEGAIGFAMEVELEDENDAILLQEIGLGGRRHFGCGAFLPVRGGNHVRHTA
jgi:CRISPR-associated protein Cas6